MTLWDYKYKNQVTKVWYAKRYMSGVVGSGRAYAFASRHERDLFVANRNKDYISMVATRQEAMALSGYTNPSKDVLLIDKDNKLVCVSL